MKQYGGINELKQERSKSLTLTTRDKELIRQREEHEESEELLRKQNMARNEQLLYENFKKMNRLLLE